jgi:hypothetical protein
MSFPVSIAIWPAIEMLADEKGLTLYEAADLAHVPHCLVHENVRQPVPPVDLVDRLLGALEFDDDDLVEAVEFVRIRPPTFH